MGGKQIGDGGGPLVGGGVKKIGTKNPLKGLVQREKKRSEGKGRWFTGPNFFQPEALRAFLLL